MKKKLLLLIEENPVFVLLLGLCPALAVTTTLESSILMGVSVIVILLVSNAIASITKKIIPENLMIPSYVIIIATLVTLVSLLLEAYVKPAYDALGIYLPLITVNCLVLGRAIAVARKSDLKTSLKDALKIGFGFLLALIIIGTTRELLGFGTITFMEKTTGLFGYQMKYIIFKTPIQFFVQPAGAFFTVGILLALINKYIKKEAK